MDDQEAMRQALLQAHSVEGRTAPRPPVGAVVVRDGTIIGRGATSPPYGPHAEIHALQEAGADARGAELYVTLEPCSVTIHTPPCTKAIIAAGIRRVIVASRDPNPLVDGRGLEQLQAAGIEVVTGIETPEGDTIIQPFKTFVTGGRPYVTAKWAMTLDGKLATHTGDAYWISGPTARSWVHNLRDRVDAIMIGSGTAHADNPQLSVRLTPETRTYERTPRSGPVRVVLATDGHLASHLTILQPALAANTFVLVGENCAPEQCQCLRNPGLTVIPLPLDNQGHIDLAVALHALAEQNIMHILLEGGAKLLGNAFDRTLIDHVAVFIAPKLIGGTQAPTPLQGQGIASMQDAIPLYRRHSSIMDEDLLIEGDLFP